MHHRISRTACGLCLLAAIPTLRPADAQTTAPQILFLGTGNPRPQRDHQGPSIAVIINRKPYLIASLKLKRGPQQGRQ